jgi:hypothetical protein
LLPFAAAAVTSLLRIVLLKKFAKLNGDVWLMAAAAFYVLFALLCSACFSVLLLALGLGLTRHSAVQLLAATAAGSAARVLFRRTAMYTLYMHSKACTETMGFSASARVRTYRSDQL